MPSPLGRIVFDEKPQFGAASATVYIAAVTCRTAAASAPANISRRNAPGRIAQGWRVPKARGRRKPDPNYRFRKRRTHQIDPMATLAFASGRGTERSNPSPSTSESSANLTSRAHPIAHRGRRDRNGGWHVLHGEDTRLKGRLGVLPHQIRCPHAEQLLDSTSRTAIARQ
jgi:hypothetical protein